MNPAEYLAGLRWLQHGVNAAVKDAETKALEFAQTLRAKSLETDHGSVSRTVRKPSITVDPDGLLEWVKANRPDEITETVRPSFATAFHGSLEIDGDQVVSTLTGEIVGFARIRPGSEGLTVRLTPESKTAAEGYVAAHLEALIRREVES